MDKVVVLGLGNTLLGDEGVGIHAIQFLDRRSWPPQVELIDGGTLSFTLAPILAAADGLIVIDAAQLQAPPGCVHTFLGDAMDRFVRTHRPSSVHEVGLADLLDIAQLSGELPARRALVAVQPQLMDWSDTLTPEAQQALPEIDHEVCRLIEAWVS